MAARKQGHEKMIKLIGSIVIVGVATLFGFELSNRLRRRTKQIRYLKMALESLETEIVFAMTPLAEACIKVSVQLADQTVGSFFQKVGLRLSKEESLVTDIWDHVLEKWRQETDLKDSEINILKQFGQTLGQQDLENQRKQIRLAISYFDQEEKQALEGQQKYESMYKSLGLLAGVFIVLIML